MMCLEERHETQLFKRWPRSAARDRIANCDFGRSIKVSILISGMHILDINEKLYNNLIDFPTESFRFMAEGVVEHFSDEAPNRARKCWTMSSSNRFIEGRVRRKKKKKSDEVTSRKYMNGAKDDFECRKPLFCDLCECLQEGCFR